MKKAGNKIKKAGIIFLLSAIVITSCGCSKFLTASGLLHTESEYSTETSEESVTSIQESSKESVTSRQESSKESETSYDYTPENSSYYEPESSYEYDTSEISNSGKKHYEKALASIYHEDMDNDPDTFELFYTNVKNERDLFKADGKDTIWYFFNFAQKGTVGIGISDKSYLDKYNAEYVNGSNTAYTEMYYGFKAEIINGRTLSVKNYTNLSGVEYIDLKIQSERPDIISPDYTVDYDKGTLTADLYDESFINGCYAITGTYEYKGKTSTCNLYLYVNCKSNDPSDYHFYICRGENDGHQSKDIDTPIDFYKKANEVLAQSDVTPENSLNLNIAYPYQALDYENPVYDTPNWITKSNEIVADYKNASKAFKATLLHDWIVANLAYDNYKIEYLDGKSRYVGHCDTDAFYPSKSHVGVCFDFANIYMIMCRAQDIPCVTCENEQENHVWNLVYIDGQWAEVDTTFDIIYHVYTEDINKRVSKNDLLYDYYFNYPKHEAHDFANSVNKCLYLY